MTHECNSRNHIPLSTPARMTIPVLAARPAALSATRL